MFGEGFGVTKEGYYGGDGVRFSKKAFLRAGSFQACAVRLYLCTFVMNSLRQFLRRWVSWG